MSLEAFLRTALPASSTTAPSFVEGECWSVSAEGMQFIIPSWDEGTHVFGPAPWPVVDPAPEKGARVLVLFLGGGVERPWVLGWWP